MHTRMYLYWTGTHTEAAHPCLLCLKVYLCVFCTHTSKSDEVASLVPPTDTLSLLNHTPAVCVCSLVWYCYGQWRKKKSPSPFLLHHVSFFFQSCVPCVQFKISRHSAHLSLSLSLWNSVCECVCVCVCVPYLLEALALCHSIQSHG